MALVPTATNLFTHLAAQNPTVAKVSNYLAQNPELLNEVRNFTARSFEAYKKRRPVRKYKKESARSNVGKPPTARGPPKSYTAVDNNPTAKATRTFYEDELTAIPKTETPSDIDNRFRDTVYINGFKFLVSLQNQSSKPLHFNLAVLMNRTSPAASTSPNDFFRGSGSSRALSFNTNLNSNDFRARPINTDENVVLTHKRVTLSAPNSTATEAGWKSSFHNMDFYLPIKRMFTYTSGTCNNRIYLVYWCDEFNTSELVATQPAKLLMSHRVITYFKEPKIQY